jgi:hypothetical protein
MITLLLDNDTVIPMTTRKVIGDMVHTQILDENGALIDVSGRVVDIMEDYSDWE